MLRSHVEKAHGLVISLPVTRGIHTCPVCGKTFLKLRYLCQRMEKHGEEAIPLREVGSGLAGPPIWSDTAESAILNHRTHYNDLLQCKHNIARKIMPAKLCSILVLMMYIFACPSAGIVFTSETSNITILYIVQRFGVFCVF